MARIFHHETDHEIAARIEQIGQEPADFDGMIVSEVETTLDSMTTDTFAAIAEQHGGNDDF